MNLKNLDELMELAKARKKRHRIAVPGAADRHVLEAVELAQREGYLTPLLIGDGRKTREIWQDLGGNPAVRIWDVADPVEAARKSVELVRAGEADFLMKGQLNTADLLRAMLDKASGLPHDAVVTNLTLLEIPWYHKLLAVNDGALIPHSTLEQKVSRLETVSGAIRTLSGDGIIKVAAIAANEEVSPKIAETVEAAELRRMNAEGRFVGCVVEGPISLDLALSPEAASRKNYSSPVAGDADLLLFPDLLSANIFNKLAELGGATPVGVLLGASVPVAITSRSASTRSKLCSLVLASILVK